MGSDVVLGLAGRRQGRPILRLLQLRDVVLTLGLVEVLWFEELEPVGRRDGWCDVLLLVPVTDQPLAWTESSISITAYLGTVAD